MEFSIKVSVNNKVYKIYKYLDFINLDRDYVYIDPTHKKYMQVVSFKDLNSMEECATLICDISTEKCVDKLFYKTLGALYSRFINYTDTFIDANGDEISFDFLNLPNI